MKKSTRGFTLVEIMIALMILTLLAAISYPTYEKSRSNAQRSVCQNNLKIIAGEADVYLFEVPGRTDVTLSDLAGRFKSGSIPVCPSGGTYSLNVNTDPIVTCDHGDGHTL